MDNDKALGIAMCRLEPVHFLNCLVVFLKIKFKQISFQGTLRAFDGSQSSSNASSSTTSTLVNNPLISSSLRKADASRNGGN